MIHYTKQNGQITYQFTNSSPYPFFVVTSGKSFPDEISSPSQYRNSYAMEYVYEGSGIIRRPNGDMPISAGDFAITMPGYYYDFIADKNNPWTKIWCVVSSSPFMSGLLSAYNLKKTECFSKLNSPLQLENIFNHLKDHGNEPDASRKVEEMLFSMICELSDFSSSHRKTSSLAELGRIYIDNMNTFDISIESICQQLSVSPSHFFRLFKKEFGQSPSDYITKKKIDHATHLLRYTSLSINQISERLGYVNTSSFSNIFCKKLNMSPNEFRKQHKYDETNNPPRLSYKSYSAAKNARFE